MSDRQLSNERTELEMSEKVLYEVRFIETDDGIRIEMKGDKDRLHEMSSRWHERRDKAREERQEWREWKRWERRFRRPWFFGCGPWWGWDDEPERKEKPESASSTEGPSSSAV